MATTTASPPRDDDDRKPRITDPPAIIGTRTTTDTLVAATTSSGGLLGRFATFGNMTGIGLIFVMFAFGGYFMLTTFSSSLKEKIADDKDDRNYQRATHDRDMLLLTNGMTKNTENTAALIQELKIGRESIDKEAASRQAAFDKRTEQQFTQIKELHDALLKKGP